MFKNESPLKFNIQKSSSSIQLKYIDLMEIVQGGPEIGKLQINGKLMEGKYGGPSLIYKNYVIVPKHTKKFLCTGFKMVVIDVNTFTERIIGSRENLIYLDEIKNNKILYFTNMEMTKSSQHDFF